MPIEDCFEAYIENLHVVVKENPQEFKVDDLSEVFINSKKLLDTFDKPYVLEDQYVLKSLSVCFAVAKGDPVLAKKYYKHALSFQEVVNVDWQKVFSQGQYKLPNLEVNPIEVAELDIT